MQNIAFAFLMTLLAGLSTGIGGALCFFTKRSNTKFLSASMGFSAGVMIYVSMIEMFAEANHMLEESFGAKQGNLVTNLAFFGGMLLIALIDKLIPAKGTRMKSASPSACSRMKAPMPIA